MGPDFHNDEPAVPEKAGGPFRPLLRRLVGAAALVILLAGTTPAYSAGGDVLWQRSDTLAGKQEARATATDSRGNTVVTGYQSIAGGINDDYYTVKMKSDGSGIAWRATFDKAAGQDQATAVVIDGDDNVIVTGFAWNGLNNDIHTVKYNGATGAVIWQHSLNGASGGNDVGTAITVDGLNNIYVGGYSQDAAGNNTYIVAKYSPTGVNPDGNPAWTVIADGAVTGINRVNSIAVGSGTVAVTGQTWNGTAMEILTVALDTAGNQLWERRYSTGGINSCIGRYVKFDQSGNVVMTASAANSLDLDIYTAKYNGSTGAIIWERTLNGAYDDEPNGLAIGPNGNVYVTGYTWTLTAQNDFYTVKLDGGTGATLWEKTFNSTNGNDDITSATGIVIDPVGDLFVTGYTVSDKNYDFQTVKYKKDNGNQLWQASFNGPAGKNDRPVGIGLSPTGEVLVAGWTDTAANDLDIQVIKYDPGLLDPPTGVAAQAQSNTAAAVSWIDNSGNEDGFSVERCRNLGCTSFAEIATVGAGVTTFNDTGLTPGTYYTYRVRAFSSASGYSHYSGSATALTVVVTTQPPAASYVYNGLYDSDDYANAIAVGPDNNPVLAGQTNDYPMGYSTGKTSFDYLITKLDRSTMTEVWKDRYNDPNTASDNATCVAVDSNNGVVVSGYATLWNGTSADVNSLYTIRYPSTGPPALRADQYNGPVAGGATDDRAVAVAIASATDASNSTVVVGYGMNAAGNNDVYLLKYNADGTRAWAATPFNGAAGHDHPTSVVLAPNGNIFVTGYSETGAGTNLYRTFTAKYSSAGALLWSDLYAPVAGKDSRNYSIALDRSGDAYVVGTAGNAAENKDIYTIKYLGTGSTATRVWERAADGSIHGDDLGAAVRIDPVDGSVVVAGSIQSGVDDHDFTIVKYSTSGDTVFSKTYLRPSSDDDVKSLGIDSNGNIYVTGNAGVGAGTDSLTVKFDYLGNLNSTTLYSGAAGSFDESAALAVNGLDEVFVAGYTEKMTMKDGAPTYNADVLVYKIAPDTAAPSVPYSITSTAGYATISLSWLDRSMVKDGYHVERRLGACSADNTASWQAVATVPADTLTFADSGLNTGSTYCYRINTYQTAGATSRWAEKEAATLAPPTPGTVTATATSTTTVAIGWNDTTNGETGFRIERCSGANCTAFAPVGTAPANATNYTDTTACNATTYRYRVLAFGPGWESPAGTIPPAVTTATPATPVLAAARLSEAEIQLSWTDSNTDESGYLIERCIGSGCTGFASVATLPANSLQYRDSGLTAGTTYSYRVKAFKTGSCPWEQASNAAAATTTLVAPAGLTATAASTTSINLAWTDNTASETGFSVEKCIGDICSNFGEIALIGPSSTSFTDTGVCAGETASYRIKAVRDAVTLSNSGDGCWTRRSPLTISGFQQNYETKLTIPHDADMLAGFDDIRFVDISAGIELPYWIESKTDSTSAVVWVKTGMNNSIYLYYGNPTATSSSNGSGVFDFFDEFSGTALNATKWSATGSATVNGGALRVDTGSVYTLAPILSNPQSKVFEMKAQWLTAAGTFSGLNIANAQSTQSNNAGANALAYFVTDSGATANLLTYGANGSAASYNIVTGSLSATVSTGNALYNPFVSNGQFVRKPASGVWSPPQGGSITRIRIKTATESCCDPFRVYNAAGVLLAERRGTVDIWLDIAPTTGIYTTFQTDGSVNGGFGGDVPEVVVTGTSATGVLNTYRILGYEFQNSTNLSYFIKNLDYTETFRSSYPGTWSSAPYLWLGYFTGAVAGTADIDDMMVDWVRVRKYAATQPTAAIGVKETSECFTFGSPWSGSYTNIATASTGTPGTPVLTATKGSEVQINLSWTDAAGDETGYKIERCAGDGCTNFAQVAVRNANVLSYSDTGLAPGATYTYRVKAYKSTLCPWERVSNTAVAATTITGPTTLTVTASSSTQIALAWTNATASETGFVIERCEGVGCTEFIQAGTASAKATSFNDGTVCNGQSYSYRVKAVNITNNVVQWESTPSPTAATVTPGLANLVLDPGFEKGTPAWGTAVGTLTGTSFDTTVIKDGGRSLKLAATGTSLGRSQTMVVTPGRSYVFSGWINASLSTGKAQCDVTGTGFDSPGIAVAAGSAQNNAGWVHLNETVTIPAGTSFATVRCFADGTPNGTVYFDAISLVPETFALTATRTTELLVALSWPDSAVDETGYRIERCTGADCTTFAQIGTVGSNVTTYNNSGLSPNTTYRYRVQGYKTSLCSWDTPYSAIGETVTTPAAPASLAASTPNTTQVYLTWTDTSASETGFEIERCTGAGCSSFARINTTGANATSFTDVTAATGTAYRYRIRALSSTVGWYSGYSGEVAVTTPVPAAPVLTATASSEVQVNLTWTDPTNDETGFRVYRCGGVGCADFTLVTSLGANVRSYNDGGRNAGGTYNYYVQSYKTGSWTSDSNVATIVTTPAAPTSLAVTAVDTTQTRLTWVNRTTSETGISIERCQGTGCANFTGIAIVGVGVTSYYDTSLCNSQPATYRVQAINSTIPWSSAYSGTASITLSAPPAPTALTATRTSEVQISLAWTDNNTDETGFKIERCAGTGCTTFAQIATTLANVKTYNDTSATPGTTYRYQVRAYKTPSLGCAWDSSYTSAAEATASIIAPSGLTATAANSTSIRLTWTNNTVSETGYKIERCTGAGCSDFTQTATVTGKATTWTDTSVTSSTSYTYRIRATSSTAAWDSGYSSSSMAATPAQGAPSNVTGTADTTRITITWADNTVDENGFTIERCQGADCTSFTQVATVSANIATWADVSVCNGQSYSYRVRAYNTAIPYETPYSNTATIVPPVPAPPVLTVSRGSEVQLTLSWTDPTTDESGYRIESCAGSGCSDFTPMASVTGTTFADTGLVPGNTYTYRVKGYKTAACPWETVSNTGSGTTTITAPASLAAAMVNTTRIDLSWSDTSASETGYKIERCTGSGCTDFREIAITGTVSSWSDITVTSGTSYTYRIRATRNVPYAWDSGYSTTASAATPAAPSPGTLTARQTSNSQIDLSWTDTATDETGYRIERCSGAGCADFNEVATTAANSAAYSSTGLASSTNYCFRIRGYKSGASPWTSDYSNTACAVTIMDAPSTLSATAVNGFTVKLTWMDTAAGENGFNIEQQVWNGEWVTVTSVGPNITSHSDSIGIEPQKSYTYRIKAFRGADSSAYSSPATVTTPAFKAGDATCDTPVTGAPVFTSQPPTVAVEGVPYSYQVTATAQQGSVTYLLTTKPQGMAISGSGAITWTPGFDQEGDKNVTVRASDSLGRTTDQNFTIVVTNADRSPTFSTTAPTAAITGHQYQYQAVATDPDGNAVSYSLTTAPAAMVIAGSGLVTWTPATGEIGSHPVTIEARAANATAIQSFTVSVTENRAPSISSTAVTTAGEGIAYSYQVVALDQDGDALTYSLGTAPSGMTVSSTGLINWIPSPAQLGATTVTVVATDGSASTSQTFTVTVAGNRTPTVASTPVTTGTEGAAYSYALAASDADGDSITYSLRIAPAGMTLSTAGALSWTPSYIQSGTHTVTVRVADARAAYTDHTFTITVAEVHQPPQITSTPPAFCLRGATYTYQVTATDPGGLPVTYSLDAAPAGMTISATGLVTWIPSANGNYPVTVRVANANAGATQPFTISVAAVPTTPILITQSGIDTGCATSTAHTLSWNASTVPDGDPAQYYVQLDTVNTFNSGNLQQSGWVTGTSWTSPAIGTATWYWRVKSRDSLHAAAESAYSAIGSFSDSTLAYTCGYCSYYDCSCDNSCGSSSCPLVYGWSGSGFQYETDLQGPAISQIKKGSRNVAIYQPSYIVMEGGLTPDENHQYKVKIWESLQEGSIIDEARLLTFDYPEGYQIVSSGAENTYYYGYADPFRIYTIKDPVLPLSVVYKNGNDVLAASSAVDNNPAPMDPKDPDNYYTLDFGTIQHPENAKLVIDGWQDINSKIYLSTIQIQPYIELVDQNGQWVKVKSFGMPAGDLKTMVVDLSDLFLSSDHRIRLHLGIKKAQVWVFDRIRLDDSAPVNITMQQLQATSANLQYAGHAIQSMVNRDHRLIATDEVQPLIPTYFGYGNFTRYGDVLPLLTQRDDKFALLNYADKVEVTFPVPMPPQAGMKRGFVLMVDNYYKEFKEYKYLEPLPFHGMSDYPYPSTENYPTDEDHTRYREEYNTRVVAP